MDDRAVEYPTVLVINFTTPSVYRQENFRKYNLKKDSLRNVPFYLSKTEHDQREGRNLSVLYIFDDFLMSPPHICGSGICYHACRDILLNKDIQSLFILPGGEDQDQETPKLNPMKPNLKWIIPSYVSSVPISITDDEEIKITQKNLSAVCYLVKSSCFTQLAQVDILASLRNTLFQLTIRDQTTAELPSVIFVLTSEGENKEQLIEKVCLELNFSGMGGWTVSNGVIWFSERTKVQFVSEKELHPGSKVFGEIERKSCMKYNSKQ